MANLKRPLLKFEIQEANANTKSAAAAARYLGVVYKTYKKYAELYGLFEEQKNEVGIGIAKGYSMSQPHSTKLKDIFDNKHPDYPLQRLRWRMVARGLLKDECSCCGFAEKRITDQKTPLLLVFKEEQGDYTPTNLIILCYNCCFLTKDSPYVVNRKHVTSAVNGNIKQDHQESWENPNQLSSNAIAPEPMGDLTDEEIRQLKREIDEELGRY